MIALLQSDYTLIEMIKKYRNPLLYVIFIIAIWPTVFHLHDILNLKVPRKKRIFIDALMISPTILVFDRLPYFSKLRFDLTYADHSKESIYMDNHFYAQLKPFPVSAFISRSLGRLGSLNDVKMMLNQIFCLKKVSNLALRSDISFVQFQIEYLPDKTHSETIEIQCLK